MKKINYVLFSIGIIFIIAAGFVMGQSYNKITNTNSCNVCNVNCIYNLRENNISNFFTSYYPGRSDNEAFYINLNQEEINVCCKC